MTLIEKLFALKRHGFFQPVEDPELILIADVAICRQFPPGAVILHPDSVPNRLLIVVGGRVVDESTGKTGPSLIGVESLVLKQPVGRTLTADSKEGAVCLIIAKGHFFTIINECPEILVRTLEHSRRSRDTGLTEIPSR